MSSSGPLCRMSEASCRQLWIAAWAKRHTARFDKNSASVCGMESSSRLSAQMAEPHRNIRTAEMVRLEREIIGRVKNGNESRYESSMLVSSILRVRIEDAH